MQRTALSVHLPPLGLAHCNLQCTPLSELVASHANRVTDSMMLAAARTLGENSPALHDPAACLLPALADVRRVATEIAYAVGLEAQKAGVAPKTREDELLARVLASQWSPAYPAITAA